MKTHKIYVAIAMMATIFIGCDNTDYTNKSPFDNMAYLDVAVTGEQDNVVFKKTIKEQSRKFSAMLTYPTDQDVSVSFTVDPALVDVYNAKHETSYTLLDASHVSLESDVSVIPAGKATTKQLTIKFVELDNLDIDVTYLVPLTIVDVSGGLSLINGSKSIYYLVKRSSAITMAANIRDNYFNIPGFDRPDCEVVTKKMKAITYEALINVHDFNYGGPKSPDGASITTIMGVEQHFLMRIGDTTFPLQQLQLDGPYGKFPKVDKSKLLSENEWYHIALTWDIEKQLIIFYVNGQEQSRSTEYGKSNITTFVLNDPSTRFKFLIGYSFENDYRQLCGEISECRIWSVARTQKEIWDNMYEVDPHTTGLEAYWKFNEGEGNISIDQTGNGNDAVANFDLDWPTGVEIPQINR